MSVTSDGAANLKFVGLLKRGTELALEQYRSTMGRGTAVSLVARAAAMAAAFAAHVVLTRVLGTDEYGVFALITAWMMIVVMVSKLGQETTLVRLVSSYRAEHRWGLLKGLRRFTRRSTTIASLAFSAAGLVWLTRTSSLSESMRTCGIVGCLLLPPLAAVELEQGTIRALKRPALAQIPESIVRPLLMGLGVLLIVVAPVAAEKTATTAMAANLAATMIALAIALAMSRRLLPREVREATAEFRPREWLSISLPLLLMAALHMVSSRVDIVMLGFLVDTGQVGVYSVASRVANLSLIGLVAANSIAAPMLAEQHARGSRKGLQDASTRAARLASAISIPVILGVAMLGQLVLSMFGAGFPAGYPALLVLLTGQAVSVVFGPVGWLLTMTGHQIQATVIVGAALVTNVLLNLALVPVFGIVGAAIATSITTAGWNLGMFGVAQRRLGVRASVFGERQRR